MLLTFINELTSFLHHSFYNLSSVMIYKDRPTTELVEALVESGNGTNLPVFKML